MNQQTCLGVIPARYPSQRLPGKPLKMIGGRTLIQRVWEQARKASRITELVIATDDQRIFDAATSFGATVLMTSDRHRTGSDRVAEVMQRLAEQGRHFDFVSNIQGDMPFIRPEVIDATIDILSEASEIFGMSTVATPIIEEDEFKRPSAVKAVVTEQGEALYFSRAPIPFVRDGDQVSVSAEQPWGYKHLGLYVFRAEALSRLTQLPQALIECREKLEQLRALAGGIRIKVAIVPRSLIMPSIEVDTEEDLRRAQEYAGSCP